MKKYLIIIIICALVDLIPVKLHAQQVDTYTHVYDNLYLLNPAGAGVQKKMKAEGVYKRQWLGLPNGPEDITFNIDGYLSNEKIGLGVNLYNSVTNILKKTGVELTYAYHIPINLDHNLSFGLSLGAKSFSIDFSEIKAQDYSDPTLLSHNQSRTNIDGSFGILYNYKKNLNIGFTAKQLFGNEILFEDQKEEKSLTHRLVRHYFAHIDYSMALNDFWTMKPMLIVSSTEGMPSNISAIVSVKYQDFLNLGVTYRNRSGFGFFSKVIVDDQIGIGYAYEYPTTELSAVSSGNHEIALSYFISNKKSKKRQKGRRLTQEDEIILTEQVDQASQEVEKAKEAHKIAQDRLVELEAKVEKLQELNSEQAVALEEVKSEYTAEAPIETIGVDAKYYTVIGTFGKLEFAKEYQKIVRRELKFLTVVVKVQTPSNKTYFFVASKETTNWGEAQDEVNRLNREVKSKLISGTPWVYLKVNE
ncbi:PorP/SprF family type IX secretion system membrane protein [Flammeovirga aprica]|uniref:PorP/SprF family type IX secretion system membrane protein n=1 Tax=Flammeovirga aprica JL-4 TaxID=694437 RepID=A0A7X9RY91_9BACT|nr:PorP/SprF family type IX secretion system membrane protein [Flammeovirga aprica]NME70880.1 PorP/SprF family type IX secretion system membrane protein [Flammeovirga aprica JL-4]